MFAKSVAALALFVGAVVAQSTNATTIDPNSVDLTTRTQWCSGEISTCGTLCSGHYNNNTCDPTTLDYSCTCTANNSAPGLQYYTETMPTYICETIYANCISANVGDSAAQAVCKTNEQNNCGHLDPANFTQAATTTTSSSSSAAGTGTAATSAPSTSSSKAAAATMVAMGREYGAGIVAAGVAAAFGFML